jgi:hypothetical protein
MGIGAAMVSTDWVALASLWEAPTSPPPPHPTEMAAQMLKQTGKWMWRLKCIAHVAGCGDMAGGAMVRVASTGGMKV